MTMLAHHCLVRPRVAMGTEAPALSGSPARRLVQVGLSKREFDAEAALAEIERIQPQNHAADRFHRKQHWRELHSHQAAQHRRIRTQRWFYDFEGLLAGPELAGTRLACHGGLQDASARRF